MHLCLRKRISVLFSYGGNRGDVVEVLQMISKGQIKPQVKMEKMENFPQVLQDLHSGKINGRVALAPKGIELEAVLEQGKVEKL
jgi:alcohol dehydrogenase, propanol-preferring